MEIERELWARELGWIALSAVEAICKPNFYEIVVKSEALKLLEGIRKILDDEELNDFECVEEIVSLLQHANISTSRHDFG